MPTVLKFDDSNYCYIVYRSNKRYDVFTGILEGDTLNIMNKVHLNSVNRTQSKSIFIFDDGELDIEMGKNIYIPYIDVDKHHISDIILPLSPINKNLKYVNNVKCN